LLLIKKQDTLKEGQISKPFKTRFGYHIIQMVNRAGDDAVVRHILKIPQVTTYEMKEGFDKMDSVRSKLVAGVIDFGKAVEQNSEDDYTKNAGGFIQGQNGTFLTIDQLDPGVVTVLKDLKIGQFSKALEYADERGKKGVRILYLKSKSEPHRENLRDDYSKVASRALEEKKETALEDWFYKKIKTYYLMIDPDYQSCDVMEKWVDAAKKSTIVTNK
jgi:peptidyl-prolyl cis-trans isomerase SurA